jgi:hypothetical protein
MNMPPSHDLIDFMHAVSTQMAGEYDRIRKRAQDDPGTAGDQGEENWATLLREWLPRPYEVVTKGCILSPTGDKSPQVDVLILSPAYPRYLLDKKLYLAGGVLAAFECKTTLRAEHLRDAMTTAVAIRRGLRPRFGTPYRELFSPLFFGILAHSHVWLSPPETIGDNLLKLLSEADVKEIAHPRELLDLVCIADLGVWAVSKGSWLGPHTLNKGDPGASEHWVAASQLYGSDGSAITNYMRAVLPSPGAPQDPQFTPIGAALSIFLRRLAWEDASVRPIAGYFREIKMEGGGPGYLRQWTSEIYSEPLRPEVIDGRHVPSLIGRKPWDSDDIWDEWALFFN